MDTFFSKLKQQLSDQLPFVLFLTPEGQQVKAYLQRDVALRLNKNFNKKGFVFAPFDTTAKSSIWFYEEECEILAASISDFSFRSNNPVFRENELYAQLFHQKIITKALETIKSKLLHKVIISRKELQYVSEIDILQIFQNIVLTYPKTFCYCWFHPKVGLWMGATPETLVSIDNGSFETMALAGTQAFVDTVNVSWGEKEKEEQQIVVDAIVDVLTENNIVSDIDVKETVTQKAGSLLHLKTPISAKLKDENALKLLIEVLHPTPAVCGLPYEDSKAFILQNEGYDRSFYTGYLGEVLNPLEARLFVNLRCMEVFEQSNKVAIYIGGGVTERSNPELEWLETVNKSRVMKSIL